MNPYQEFIHQRSYARWREQDHRRETWVETVGRFSSFFWKNFVSTSSQAMRRAYSDAIDLLLKMEVMPSMRCLWAAGLALERENLAGYNCAYTPIAAPKDLAEVLYILMNGTGVGVSVERQNITQLPTVPHLLEGPTVVVCQDSKQGWAEGFYTVLRSLYDGVIPSWDLSSIRPAGARLHTFGGRASGPGPLAGLFEFTVKTFKAAQGRKLTSEEVADICCKIAETIVVGGVRRSAILLLTNPSDRRMAEYKRGEFWTKHPYRCLANVSAVYEEKQSPATFLADWLQLMQSGTGERGIVNRKALKSSVPERRDNSFQFGLNPCGEIILRPKQLCNLTEVVLRPGDNELAVFSKIEAAAIFGCLQALLTNFGFIDHQWRANCEEERLLGLSLTGCMDVNISPNSLAKYKQHALWAAEHFSKALGMKKPMAVTCVKPSGTVSQLVGAASGLHARYAKYYIRRVRVAKMDPLATFLQAKGVPWEEDMYSPSLWVFRFPEKSPDTAVCRDTQTAIQQLETWALYKKVWCEHNPSVTISVREDEWVETAAWVNRNWDLISGVTFLPYDTGVYEQAPYEEITEEMYKEAVSNFPKLDFQELQHYESNDSTNGWREYACAGGGCD